MPHNSTPANTLHRSYDSGGARALISEVNDNPLMQEMAGSFMKGEARKGIEAPQNYGFSSVVRDATKGKDGQIEASAEGFMSFIGGNRSFPVCAIMDDRRYRLKELKKGDVAMFDYLQHQLHFNDKGMFLTGRTDKKVKIQLAPPPQDQSGGGSGKSAGTLDASGSSSGSSSSSGSQDKGQKQRYDQTSQHYLEMTKDAHNLVHDQTINYKSGTHQFQPPSSGAATQAGGGMLVQIFGDKFTAGLGHFMKQVEAAPPIKPTHVTTKGYVDAIFAALGITIPPLPPLPFPPLPPGITLPPGFTLPSVAASKSPPPNPAMNIPKMLADIMRRLDAIESRLAKLGG